MSLLTCEVATLNTEWRPLQHIRMIDPPGSIIDVSSGHPDVILFGCMGNSSLITRAVGSTIVRNPDVVRDVLIRGRLTLEAQLYNGESFEINVMSANGTAYRARWTHHD